MAKAIWNGVVIAESDQTMIVEGNHYFPPDAVKKGIHYFPPDAVMKEYLKPSNTHTTCGWKGQASYYDVVVDGRTNKDAAWYYPDPLPAAKNIAGHVAFWRGVTVEA
jgi:uncharacterized protein (DUF427 family)